MKSHGVAQLLAALGITKSHSRPHVSNDNPFSESQFKTLKYRPDFPNRFGSQEDARDFCQGFFAWYNQEHYHSGIGLLTPASVHYGDADTILAKSQAVLDVAYARRPERFVHKTPSPPERPTAVWINPPPRAMESSHGIQSPLFEVQTPCEPVKPKTELEISRLTSAEVSTRPQIPFSQDVKRNHGAHENGLAKMKDLGKPDAPLTHPRRGYPSASCFPAELASVSPGDEESTRCHVIPQPLNTRVMPEKIPGGLGDWSPRQPLKMRPNEQTLH